MSEPTKRRYIVVHPQISYPSVETGAQVERRAGDEITDINPGNWLIKEGLVRLLHKDDDPKEIRADARAATAATDAVVLVAGLPVPDVVVAVVGSPAPPAPPSPTDKE